MDLFEFGNNLPAIVKQNIEESMYNRMSEGVRRDFDDSNGKLELNIDNNTLTIENCSDELSARVRAELDRQQEG